MSEQWDAPEGASDASYQPFDRNALAASLADALKDVTGEEDTAAPSVSDSGPARVPNPFGRPNAPVGAIPAPTPAPLPSAPSVAPRTGPSILSGGLGGVLGGSTVSAFGGPQAGGGIGLGGSGLGAVGLGPRPLGPLGGMGAQDPPEPAPTITLKRNRPERDSEAPAAAAPAAVPAPAPARPMVPLAGWTPADDDILPSPSGGRRRGKAQKAPKMKADKAPKPPKVKAEKGAKASSEKAPKEIKEKRFRLK